MNPAVNFLIRGQPDRSYFGLYGDKDTEGLVQDWLEAGTETERKRLADAIQAIAFRRVPYVPLGQYVRRAAYRDTAKGILPRPAALPWNVSKV